MKPRQLWSVWLALGLLMVLGAGFVWLSISQLPKPATAVPTEDLTISERSLDPGRSSVYRYRVDPSTQVDFFVSKTAGSTIEAGIASCRRCYRSGHYGNGSDIMCGHCAQPMRLAHSENDVPAAKDCTLVPLSVERQGNDLMVRGESVRTAFRRWFQPVLAQTH